MALALLNHGPFFLRGSLELRTHFEPASETERVDKDSDEVEEDYPPADLPAGEAPAMYGGNRPTSALDGEAQPPQLYQHHLSLQLGALRQETNRSAGMGLWPTPARQSV